MNDSRLTELYVPCNRIFSESLLKENDEPGNTTMGTESCYVGVRVVFCMTLEALG